LWDSSIPFEARRIFQSKNFARHHDMAYEFQVKLEFIYLINVATNNPNFLVTKTKGSEHGGKEGTFWPSLNKCM
jgi:hypothetical protein